MNVSLILIILLIGALATFRQIAWKSAETTLLTSLSHAWGHAHGALTSKRLAVLPTIGSYVAHRGFGVSMAALVILILAFPVRFSVLAPAAVVGAHPVVIAAPLDAIIATMDVEPNQAVSTGSKLFTMLDTQLNFRRDEKAVSKAGDYMVLSKPAIRAQQFQHPFV